MNRAQVIQLIEHELVQGDEATNEQQFEKHMYAIHTLTSIYANNESKRRHQNHKVRILQIL